MKMMNIEYLNRVDDEEVGEDGEEEGHLKTE